MKARWRQAIVNRVVKRAQRMLIVPSHSFSPTIAGASYNYVNTDSQFTPAGAIYVGDGGLIVRINEVDANGTNYALILGAMQAGDVITIGPQSATLVNAPGRNVDVWAVFVDAWPALADGTYVVTVERL